MAYDIYILEKSLIAVSGGRSLDGMTQGDGSHLVGQTLTLTRPDWKAVRIADRDAFFADNDTSQRLDGAQVIDGRSYPAGTVVEAEYSLVLTDGVKQWTVVGFNVVNSSPAYATVEGLAFIGGPGGFPPHGVPLRVVKAADYPKFAATDYATPICFGRGTLIDTPEGPRPVEEIAVGDRVLTRDRGPQPVRWRAARSLPAAGAFAPIRFAAGAIGNRRPLLLSPQHRILVRGWRAQMYCGTDAVLVPALRFLGRAGVTRAEGGTVEYHHLLFDRHEVIRAEGVETESFCPGPEGLRGLDEPARQELLALFPELGAQRWPQPVAPMPDAATARLVALGG
jgi:hypothetical protein